MRQKTILIATVFLYVFGISEAQTVSNVRFSQEGKQVYITYSLDKTADISVYLSENGGQTFGTALQQVSGDVGESVAAGDKTIVWDVLAEREKLQSSSIAFKVRAVSGVSCFTVKGVTFEMVKVQGGTFTMGCTPEQGSDCEDDEKPSHRVTLSDYYMGRYEVTQELWQAVMGSNPSYNKGSNLPVEKVSWNDCQEFIRKLNSLTGQNFRLPTEAEWEYAARGGNRSVGYKYSGSKKIDNVAWYSDNSSNTHATSTGTKWSNELGIYSMSGNVMEWCQDWYGSYSSSSQTNPTGSSIVSYRILRGGSWAHNAKHCRVSRRSNNYPGTRSNYNGFRLAL